MVVRNQRYDEQTPNSQAEGRDGDERTNETTTKQMNESIRLNDGVG